MCQIRAPRKVPTSTLAIICPDHYGNGQPDTAGNHPIAMTGKMRNQSFAAHLMPVSMRLPLQSQESRSR